MFRFVYLPLVFALCLLTACGGGGQPPAEPTATTLASTAESMTTIPTVVEPTLPTLAPTVPVEPTSTQEPTLNQYGITASYPAVLGQNVIASIQEPQTQWDSLIAYYQFAWVDYPVTETFTSPLIQIYAVADYSALEPAIAEEIAELQKVLADQPDLAQLPEMPYVFINGAAQMLHTQESFLTFQNGRGVRYLTFYAQNSVTITSKDLFYTFHGLTDDGKFFVRATFPVELSTLPTAPTEVDLPNYTTYLADLETEIRQLDPAVFNPHLSLLDQLIQSLTIQAEPLPTIPTPEAQG